MSTRRVVTGQNAEGKAVFVVDEEVAPVTVGLMPGLEFRPVWGADDRVVLPTDGAPPSAPAYFPPAGGFRFAFVTLPPEGSGAPAAIDVEAALAEVEAKLPGLVEHMEPDHPGMHTTDTVDFDVVISGELWLELDDGAEVHLKAGDCVVQNGTRHAWHNRSSQPCTLAVALVGVGRAR
jgi:mannose-6-phosphate isomerase-like protein (cupin superfamily)